MTEKEQEVNGQAENLESAEVNETPAVEAETPAEEITATPEEPATAEETPEETPEEPAEEPAAEPETPAEVPAIEDEPVKEIFAQEPVVKLPPVPAADFDWNAIGKKQDKYSEDERSSVFSGTSV